MTCDVRAEYQGGCCGLLVNKQHNDNVACVSVLPDIMSALNDAIVIVAHESHQA